MSLPRGRYPMTDLRAKEDRGTGRSVASCQRCDRDGRTAMVSDRFGMRPVLSCDSCFPRWRNTLVNQGADLIRPGEA